MVREENFNLLSRRLVLSGCILGLPFFTMFLFSYQPFWMRKRELLLVGSRFGWNPFPIVCQQKIKCSITC